MSYPKANLWRLTSENSKIFGALNKSKSANLLIIGGGYTGCSAALEAASSGKTVVLIEAQLIGYGGSGRNVCLLYTSPSPRD